MYDSSTDDGRNNWKHYNGISAQRGTVKKFLAGVGGAGGVRQNKDSNFLSVTQ